MHRAAREPDGEASYVTPHQSDPSSSVITFVTGQDLPLSGQSRSQERTLLSGTLAASMERLIRVAVQSVSTPCGILTLLGGDRRAFTFGELTQPWMAHDTGVLVRHG